MENAYVIFLLAPIWHEGCFHPIRNVEFEGRIRFLGYSLQQVYDFVCKFIDSFSKCWLFFSRHNSCREQCASIWSASRCETKAGHAITSTPESIPFQPAKKKNKNNETQNRSDCGLFGHINKCQLFYHRRSNALEVWLFHIAFNGRIAIRALATVAYITAIVWKCGPQSVSESVQTQSSFIVSIVGTLRNRWHTLINKQKCIRCLARLEHCNLNSVSRSRTACTHSPNKHK